MAVKILQFYPKGTPRPEPKPVPKPKRTKMTKEVKDQLTELVKEVRQSFTDADVELIRKQLEETE